MKSNLTALACALALVAPIVGCGTSRPPQQLLDARTAYQKASTAPGASMIGGDLYEARQALDAAEQAYKQEGANDEKTKTLAYVAHRKAIAAQGKAETVQALEEKRTALAEFERFRDSQAAAARQQLDREKERLEMERQRVESERQARIAAEQKVQEALEQIEGLQASQSERGYVLTLPATIAFGARGELTPEGKKRLAEIAQAVKDDPRRLTIVGHTDSTGPKQANKRVSEQRAKAVRDFLVGEGVDEARIRTQGMGSEQPIADNTKPEGRALNRRVEIILEARPPEPESPPAGPGPEGPRENPPGAPPGPAQPRTNGQPQQLPP
jgi:outer membrane protein OmpA-like peptidoglycan-associated protein